MTCEHWWYAQPPDRDGTVRMDCQRCGAHQERRVRFDDTHKLPVGKALNDPDYSPIRAPEVR